MSSGKVSTIFGLCDAHFVLIFGVCLLAQWYFLCCAAVQQAVSQWVFQRVTIKNYTRFECGMIINFLLFIRAEWRGMSPLIAELTQHLDTYRETDGQTDMYKLINRHLQI